MSRIDKGGTKFKPMMPRGQRDRISEKPRSSTAPRSKGTETNVLNPSLHSAEASGVDLLVTDTATTAVDLTQQAEQPPDNVSTQGETARVVVPPVGNALRMPSRSGTLGNAISMPGGQRAARPISIPAANSRAGATEVSANPPLPESSAPPKGTKRKGQKRKADNDPPSQEAEGPEPAKRRRQQPVPEDATDTPSTSRRTTRASAARAEDEGNDEQEPEGERRTRRRTRAESDDEDDDDDDLVGRHRKARPHVDKPVNAVPNDVIPLDETTTTMKDLCNGLGQGRVSGRFLEVFIESNEATKRKRGENLRLKELTRRKELGLPLDDDEAHALSARGRRIPALPPAPSQEQDDAPLAELRGEEDEDEYAGVTVTTRAPKVRYDTNGNLVLDETELQFDRQAEADEEQAARGPMEVIVETDRGRFTNHASYSKKPRVDRWSKDETEQFYMGLRMFHTSFELIARTLQNRNRTMVRNKFKAEDRKNPEKVTHYLSTSMRLPYDLNFLSRETGRDFSGPIPQVQAPVALIEEEEEAEKDDESVKQRLSTAPPSGGDSDREGTSMSTGRGRSTAKSKGKRKSSKSSNTPRLPSIPPRSTSVVTLTGSLAESSTAPERDKESGPRPPKIVIANVSQRRVDPASGVQLNRTTLSISGGRNTLVLPGGGREFRRND